MKMVALARRNPICGSIIQRLHDFVQRSDAVLKENSVEYANDGVVARSLDSTLEIRTYMREDDGGTLAGDTIGTFYYHAYNSPRERVKLEVTKSSVTVSKLPHYYDPYESHLTRIEHPRVAITAGAKADTLNADQLNSRIARTRRSLAKARIKLEEERTAAKKFLTNTSQGFKDASANVLALQNKLNVLNAMLEKCLVTSETTMRSELTRLEQTDTEQLLDELGRMLTLDTAQPATVKRYDRLVQAVNDTPRHRKQLAQLIVRCRALKREDLRRNLLREATKRMV